ncbi:hypothetical protein B0A55_07989 [Friedmanniomyces simplex]|uniref:SET domain-containing protein n=1 Tax=Friedmanniomyces simplex TaxID=329884 RepID=A0A4U0X033_9PEZI|nr:hypothetical protein B0A55_07989 [Friedmanniomyces simplex]
MATQMATENSPANLNHIYFFVNSQAADTARDAAHNHSPTLPTLSRSASPSAGSSDGDSGSGSSSSSNSALNPLAANFEPTGYVTPPVPAASKLYELREIGGKGLGLFAISFIPIGTCIIAEQPLLHIHENALHLAWGPYCRLSNAQKKAFDALHFHKSNHLHLEHASRLNLIDHTDHSLDAEDVEELVQDQVRVMGTFACNNFQCGKGLAVFATTSHLNHSCVPNVHHSYNPTINKQTVYAVRDIQPVEELCTTYLGGQGAYYVRAQRIESLRNNYGFTCACASCLDMMGQSDGRRELMSAIACGLQVFQYGGRSIDAVPFVPTSPVMALKQAEDLICMLVQEGILSIELCKAYRMASMLALGLGEFERARDYAVNEAEVERNCLGTKLDDLVKSGAGAACWSEKVREAMVKAGVLPLEAKVKKPKTAQKKLADKLRRQQRTARKAAEKEAQIKAEKDAGKEQKAAEKRAKLEAQREEERKRKEYDAAFPGLKG